MYINPALRGRSIGLRLESRDTNGCDCLSGGAVAGIVIGSVAGVLLLIWLFQTTGSLGKAGNRTVPVRYGSSMYYTDSQRRSGDMKRSRDSGDGRRRKRSMSGSYVVTAPERVYVTKSR